MRFIVAPPGSGKTLLLVQREIPHFLKEGRKVFHNIPGLNAVKLAYYCKLYPEDVVNQLEYMYESYILKFIEDNGLQAEYDKVGLDVIEEKYFDELSKIYREAVPEILEKISLLPKNYFIVLDEAQNFIGATDFKEKKNIKFFEYATVHRHRGHELYLATQHEDNVDVKCRRIANLLVYLYRRDVLGVLFANTVTEKHYAGCATGNPELLNKYVTRFDKKCFGMYKSYNETGIKENRKFRSIWRNSKLYVLGLMFLFCAFVFLPKFLKTWGIIGDNKKAVPVASVVDVPSPVDFKNPVNPSLYLGEYRDYYCSDSLYILRLDGSIDTYPTNGVPVYVCPYKDYYPSEVKK